MVETKCICFVIRCRKVRQRASLELETLTVRLGGSGGQLQDKRMGSAESPYG